MAISWKELTLAPSCDTTVALPPIWSNLAQAATEKLCRTSTVCGRLMWSSPLSCTARSVGSGASLCPLPHAGVPARVPAPLVAVALPSRRHSPSATSSRLTTAWTSAVDSARLYARTSSTQPFQ
jgi:hypothetical protein